MKTLAYYAFAENDKGKIGQLLVTRIMGDRPGERISSKQEWTGKIYESIEAARADMMELNCR